MLKCKASTYNDGVWIYGGMSNQTSQGLQLVNRHIINFCLGKPLPIQYYYYYYYLFVAKSS